MFLLHCSSDNSLVISQESDVVFEDSVVKGDIVQFFYGRKEYRGKVIERSDDEKSLQSLLQNMQQEQRKEKALIPPVCADAEVMNTVGSRKRSTTKSKKFDDSRSNLEKFENKRKKQTKQPSESSRIQNAKTFQLQRLLDEDDIDLETDLSENSTDSLLYDKTIAEKLKLETKQKEDGNKSERDSTPTLPYSPTKEELNEMLKASMKGRSFMFGSSSGAEGSSARIFDLGEKNEMALSSSSLNEKQNKKEWKSMPASSTYDPVGHLSTIGRAQTFSTGCESKAATSSTSRAHLCDQIKNDSRAMSPQRATSGSGPGMYMGDMHHEGILAATLLIDSTYASTSRTEYSDKEFHSSENSSYFDQMPSSFNTHRYLSTAPASSEKGKEDVEASISDGGRQFYQLFGKDFAENDEKMILLRDGIYCKQSVLTQALGASKQATHFLRRLILGVFKEEALVNTTLTGAAPRAAGRVSDPSTIVPLDPVAASALIKYAKAVAKAKNWSKAKTKTVTATLTANRGNKEGVR